MDPYKNLEDLDFTHDMCPIPHKLEDMQVKKNKLAIEEEASKIGLPSGEHREKKSNEDSLPTAIETTTSTTNNDQHK
ncbi:unnamed protein product [Trichobilharzia regenti]|nr:unnamed protein product [Trichobilharzia regenti]